MWSRNVAFHLARKIRHLRTTSTFEQITLQVIPSVRRTNCLPGLLYSFQMDFTKSHDEDACRAVGKMLRTIGDDMSENIPRPKTGFVLTTMIAAWRAELSWWDCCRSIVDMALAATLDLLAGPYVVNHQTVEKVRRCGSHWRDLVSDWVSIFSLRLFFRCFFMLVSFMDKTCCQDTPPYIMVWLTVWYTSIPGNISGIFLPFSVRWHVILPHVGHCMTVSYIFFKI